MPPHDVVGPMVDRATEDQFYCHTCLRWVGSPSHMKKVVRGVGTMCPTTAVAVHSCGIPVTGIPFDTPPEIRELMVSMHVAERDGWEAAELAVYGDVGGRGYPTDWREHTKIDYSRCPHTVATVVHVEGWDIVVCRECGDASERHCAHDDNEWNEEGTILLCTNCGIEGT